MEINDRSVPLVRFKSDRTLWVTVFALICAGMVTVYSSSFIYAQEKFDDGLFFFKKHLIYTFFGISAFIAGWKIPIKRLRKLTPIITLSIIVFLIFTLVPGLSHRAGGASRWINIFGLTFQPAELAKFGIILFVANQLYKKADMPTNWKTGLFTYFIGLIPIYYLLLKQPDFGTVALAICTTVFMMFASGKKMKYLTTAGILITPIITALIFSSTYRRNRVFSFLDPWSDPADKGFQIIQSFLAFYSGKIFGVGLGNSQGKLFYLPEAHNDFVFAVVGEELGLMGVILLVGLFLLLALRGFTIANRLIDPFHRGLATGITALISLQAFFNMGVVLGLLPTKGFPLPLISYGGTSLIITLFMLGILAQLSEKLE